MYSRLMRPFWVFVFFFLSVSCFSAEAHTEDPSNSFTVLWIPMASDSASIEDLACWTESIETYLGETMAELRPLTPFSLNLKALPADTLTIDSAEAQEMLARHEADVLLVGNRFKNKSTCDMSRVFTRIWVDGALFAGYAPNPLTAFLARGVGMMIPIEQAKNGTLTIQNMPFREWLHQWVLMKENPFPPKSRRARLEKKRFEEVMSMGWTLYHKGYLLLASQAYSEAMLIQPQYAPVYAMRGFAFQSQGFVRFAIEEFNEFYRFTTEDIVEVRYNRGFLYCEIRKFEEAVEDLEVAVELGPENGMYWDLLGKAYQELEDWENAIVALSKSLSLAPDRTHVYALRSLVYFQLGKYEKALQDVELGIEKDFDLNYFWDKAVLLVAMGQEEQAMREVEFIFKRRDESDKPKMGTFLSKATPEDALHFLDVCLEAFPENEAFLLKRAYRLKVAEEYERALVDVDQLLAIERDFTPLMIKADILVSLGETVASKDLYLEMLSLNEGNVFVQSALGDRYLELNIPDSAVFYLSAAIESGGYFEQISIHDRGYAYLKLAEYEKCVTDFTRQLELELDSIGNPYLHRATCYRELGNHEAAAADLVIALENHPDNAEVYLNRGTLFWVQGKEEEARADFEKALEIEPLYDEALQALAEMEVEK